MDCLVEKEHFRITRFVAPPLGTNCYQLTCRQTGCVALIDVGLDCPAPEALSSIFLTHSHWDHIAGLASLQKQTSVSTWVHPDDADNLLSPGIDGVPQLFAITPAGMSDTYKEGDRVLCGHLELVVIHTPGHSPGSVCLYLEREGALFSGDTLFKQSCGTVAFPSSSAADMITSLKRLAELSGETRIFPGHGPPTRIADEPWLSRAEVIFS